MWTINWLGYNDGDDLLEVGEKAQITVWLVPHDGTDFNLNVTSGTASYFDDGDDTNSYLMDENHEFRIQVKTSEGAALSIERTLPGYIDQTMDLN